MKIITIIGTKGVGKTTLFRQLVRCFPLQPGKSKFNPSPVINYAENLIKIDDNFYRLIDTPAFIFSPQNEIEKGIKKQTEDLLKISDLICLVIDKQDERAFALKKYLKKFSASQILIFNQKNDEKGGNSFSCSTLNSPYFLAISVLRTTDLAKLSQQIISLVPKSADGEIKHQNQELKLLIFGPPNSGKSTLMNYLLQENRSLATPIAGTTREPEIFGEQRNVTFELVDTAGEKHNKPLIIIVNKYDLLAEKKFRETIGGEKKNSLSEPKKELEKELRNRLKSLSYVPIIFLSALKGTGMKRLLKILKEMLTQAQKKVSKKELAEIVARM
ncbi:9011_t:CDS:2, partial [Cetraspora pellucida]